MFRRLNDFIVHLAVLLVLSGGGCAVESDAQAPKADSQPEEVEDGYSSPNANERRASIYPHFKQLEESDTPQEENEALKALASWAASPDDGTTDGYIIRVETTDHTWLGQQELNDLVERGGPVTLTIECPSFPPVTPSLSHRFKDAANLKELLHVLWEPPKKNK